MTNEIYSRNAKLSWQQKINHAIHTNKMKEKYHMVHLIDADKVFDKTQHP